MIRCWRNGIFRCGSQSLRFGAKNSRPIRLLTELMDELVQAANCIAEAVGNLGAGESVDEIRPQGFILAVSGVSRNKKDLSRIH